MAKAKINYTCTGCGGVSNKWAGQCPSCDRWNTLVETIVESGGNRYSNQAQGIAQTAPVMSLAVGTLQLREAVSSLTCAYTQGRGPTPVMCQAAVLVHLRAAI